MIDRALLWRLGQWVGWMVGLSSVFLVLRGVNLTGSIKVIVVAFTLGILFGAFAYFREVTKDAHEHGADFSANRTNRLWIGLLTYWALTGVIVTFVSAGIFLLLNTALFAFLFNYKLDSSPDTPLGVHLRSVPWAGRALCLVAVAVMLALSIYTFRFTLV